MVGQRRVRGKREEGDDGWYLWGKEEIGQAGVAAREPDLGTGWWRRLLRCRVRRGGAGGGWHSVGQGRPSPGGDGLRWRALGRG
ncbi:hypothetical protein E2562_012056 [Oryza meyeriana var. granulata]|uniref:Uncharacterized protein n=1 Tax=Oryza meyeriana var. granulata TaxID=110450 RepID=A0A6G1D2H9_9ORYZ|nr:hypothetical protein E2562_012056 [Oryza meyeriana var. granulata]